MKFSLKLKTYGTQKQIWKYEKNKKKENAYLCVGLTSKGVGKKQKNVTKEAQTHPSQLHKKQK